VYFGDVACKELRGALATGNWLTFSIISVKLLRGENTTGWNTPVPEDSPFGSRESLQERKAKASCVPVREQEDGARRAGFIMDDSGDAIRYRIVNCGF